VENFAFTIDLKDLITGPSKKMQQSLIDTRKQLLAANDGTLTLVKASQSLEKAMVKSAAVGDVKAYQKQRQQLAMLKTQLDMTDQSELKMADGLAKQIKESEKSIASIERWTSIVSAAAVVGVKFAEGFFDLIKGGALLAIQQSDLKEKLIATLGALGKGPDAGKKTLAMIDQLSEKLPQTRDDLAGWTKQFQAMGMTDLGQLQNQLKATASAQALMGDEGAETFTNLSKKIQESIATSGNLKLASKHLAGLAATGVNVVDVANQMGMSAKDLEAKLKAGTVSASAFGDALNKALVVKGAGPLNQMAGSLDSLGKKFRENIGKMFEDIDPGPFLDAMKEIVGTFSQGTESGKGMKEIITSFFNAFFKDAAVAVRWGHILFLGIAIGALKAYLVIKPFKEEIKLLGMVIGVAALAFAASFTPAIIAGTVALWGLIAAAAVAAAPFLAIGAAVVAVGEAIYQGYKLWKEVDWAGLGKSIVTGIVGGLTDGAKWLVSSVEGLAAKAEQAFKKKLGIASPSRVFMGLGMHTAGGFAVGMRAGTPAVRSSATRMAATAYVGASRGPQTFTPRRGERERGESARASGGSGITVHVGGIHIQGAGKGADELTETAVSLLFEKMALHQGLSG
jgi:hypothetical protein